MIARPVSLTLASRRLREALWQIYQSESSVELKKEILRSSALVADQAPEARRGAVVGVFSAVFLVGNAGGASAFGYVAHGIGYASMWGVLTALLLAGAAISLRLADPRPALVPSGART